MSDFNFMEGGTVRKFFKRACLGAALFGCSGLARAGEQNVAYQYNPATSAGSLSDSWQNGSNPFKLSSFSDSCGGGLFDNTIVFAGADTYKSIGERITNINGGTGALTSSFGGVLGFNSGIALGDSDFGGQIGASYGAYDPKGRLAVVRDSTGAEEQAFVTAGVFKRGDVINDCDAISFGVVVDSFTANDWGVNASSIDLGQLRGIVGYALSDRFEVGAFGATQLWDDTAAITVAGAPGVRGDVHAANQLNGYVRGNTLSGGSLMGYAGGFGGGDIQKWQFGATGEAPLSDYFSLYGNFNYAVPHSRSGSNGSGEEQFAMQFGLAYYIGGKAVSKSVTGQKGLPLLDVANNSSFLITD